MTDDRSRPASRECENTKERRPPDHLDTVVAETLTVPARVWQAAFAGFLDTPDFSGDLASVSAPSLIMWGDKDAYAPWEHQDRLAAPIPGARLIVYEGAGHGFHWEDPAQFTKDLVVFLATVSSQSAPASVAQR